MKSALTPEQQTKIRELYAAGRHSYRELSKMYFVCTSTIYNIIKNSPKSEMKKFSGYYRKPERNKYPMKKKFDKKKVTKNLIEAVSDFALMDNWTEVYLMETLLCCGLVKEDFDDAGYLDFYEEYFDEAV